MNNKRPKQKLQPKQAYSEMFPNAKTIIDAEWKEKIESDEDSELLAIQGAYLKYMNMLRLSQMLDAETDEVKADVERYRQQKKLEGPSGIPPLLDPLEEGLPQAQKDRLVEWRSIQR